MDRNLHVLQYITAIDAHDNADLWQSVQRGEKMVLWRIGHRHYALRQIDKIDTGLIAKPVNYQYFMESGSRVTSQYRLRPIKPKTRLMVVQYQDGLEHWLPQYWID